MVDNPSFNLEVQRLAPDIEKEQMHLATQLVTFRDAGAPMREDGKLDGNGECTLVINTRRPLNAKLYHYTSFFRPPKEGRTWTHVAFRSFISPDKNHIAKKLGVRSRFVVEVDENTLYVLGRNDDGKFTPKKGIIKLNPDKNRPKKELKPDEVDEDAHTIDEVEFTADDLESMREAIGVLQGKLEQLRVQL